MRTLLDSWLVWAILAAVFAALTAIFGKIGVEKVDPVFATLIRTMVILVFAAAMTAAFSAASPIAAIAPRTWTFLILSGLATGLSWLCYYQALKLGPASAVAPVDKLSVVLVAIFATAFRGEHLSARNMLGVLMIAIGAVLTAMR